MTPTEDSPVVQPGVAGAPPIWRRLFHASAGSALAGAGIFLPVTAMVVGLAVLTAFSLSLDLVRFRVPPLNRTFLRWLAPLLKPDEGFKVTGATFMLAAGLAAFIALDRPVAVTALFFLALGDPAAALVGFRGWIPRYMGKSILGPAAFILVSLAVVAVLAGTGVIDWHWRWVAGAVTAGIVESVRLPLDDNLTVPLVGGAVMQFPIWLGLIL